ncbi:MAG TPA: aldo/keto reductase [Planctomycetaceae bacterium]|nr:aldo/keto reductase [Planctomycetaceae bacterium]
MGSNRTTKDATNRREFLGAAAGAVAATQLPFEIDTTAKAAENRGNGENKKAILKPASTDPCALVPLTDTIRCSRIGFGTGMRGGNRESNVTRMGREKANRMLRFAYDHGVRLFDCADLYGTHAFVAEALEGKPRDSYTLVSKLWVLPGGIPEPLEDRPDVVASVERFLKELKTDHIDLVQLHCMTAADWPTKWARQMDALAKLKEQGKIRAHGVSTHSNKAVVAAAESNWADAVHVRLNSEGERMDGKPSPETVANTVDAVRKAHDAGLGVVAMKVVGEGVFRDKPELRKKSTDFETNLDCVNVMIVGFDETEHITEFIGNVAAALKTA